MANKAVRSHILAGGVARWRLPVFGARPAPPRAKIDFFGGGGSARRRRRRPNIFAGFPTFFGLWRRRPLRGGVAFFTSC